MNKKKLFLIINMLLMFIMSFGGLKVSASSIINMTLYTKLNLDLQENESKMFSFAIPDNKYYYIRIEGNNRYEINIKTKNYNCSTTGKNIFFEFKDEPCSAIIDVKCLSKENDINIIVIREMVASLIGFRYEDGLDTRPDLERPYNKLNEYIKVTKYTEKGVVLNGLLYKDYRNMFMLNSPILFFSGHGNSNKLELPEGGGINGSFLPELFDNKISVLSSCEGAYENGDSKCIARKFVEKGARSSIAWPTEITPSAARNFTNLLFDYLMLGLTIQEAALNVKQRILIGRIKNYKIFGDLNTKIIDSSFGADLLIKQNVVKTISDIDNYFMEKLDGDNYRLYRKYNGYKTSEYIDCIKIINDYYSYSDSESSIKDKKILPINYSYLDSPTYKNIIKKIIITVDTDIIYNVVDDLMIPIQYVFIKYKDKNVIKYMEYLLNLNNCEELSYEKYGFI